MGWKATDAQVKVEISMTQVPGKTFQSDGESSNSSLHSGNGDHISFWKDRWLGARSLKDESPSLSLLANNQESTISQYWQDNSWTPQFRKEIQD